MRFCLACRYISGDGPLCTRCGRSFGGKLCQSKQRHLNPPDAMYCGHCGTQNLTDAASYVSLGCPAKLLLLGMVAALVWWGTSLLLPEGGLSFTAITGYRSPLVWLFEKFGVLFFILFMGYFLAGLIPGEAGKQFRKLLSKLCSAFFQFLLLILQKIINSLMHLLKGSPTKQ